MTKQPQRLLYRTDPTIHQAVKIDPALRCSSCGQAANAGLLLAVFRIENAGAKNDGEGVIEVPTGEWLLKPTCGICAEGLATQYTKLSD